MKAIMSDRFAKFKVYCVNPNEDKCFKAKKNDAKYEKKIHNELYRILYKKMYGKEQPK